MSVNSKMTAIADAIREQTEDTAKLTLDDMPVAIRSLSNQIVATETGETIVLTDSAYAKLKGLTIYGKTTQTGTPTPESPVELASAGDDGSLGVSLLGKNLFNSSYVIERNQNGITTSLNADGSVNLSGISTYGERYIKSDDDVFFELPAGTYTISPNFQLEVLGVGRYYGTFTLSEKTSFTSAVFVVPVNEPLDTDVYIQLEIGSIATDYEPYKEPQTLTVSTTNGLPGIPVSSGGNYIDSNGQQWICDEVDFTRGVYVQRIDEVDLANLRFSAVLGKEIAFQTRFATMDDENCLFAMCNFYPGRTRSEIYLNNGIDGYRGICCNASFIRIVDNVLFNGDDVALQNYASEQSNAGNPILIKYVMATPIETPLSAEELEAYASLHTHYPNTTILNDDGAGMAVSYVASTKNYIDNQVAAVSAAILNL